MALSWQENQCHGFCAVLKSNKCSVLLMNSAVGYASAWQTVLESHLPFFSYEVTGESVFPILPFTS
jgi:hypothetical protein